MTVILQLRWLAGNCSELEHYNFGVADMPEVVDLMDNAFREIQVGNKNITDEDFMFNIFAPIAQKVEPFRQYLEYMFKHRASRQIGIFNNEENIVPYDLMRSDLFYPTRCDIV